MFDIVTNLISERKIPALDELQMEALLHHLFTATPRDDLPPFSARFGV